MAKTINRISGLDSGKYVVEETKDDNRKRQNQDKPESGNLYSPDKEQDRFDKKGGQNWKKILPDSRQALRSSTFRTKEEISLNRIEVSEFTGKVRKRHWLEPHLRTLGILTGKREIRIPIAIAYGLLTILIGSISITLLRIFLF